MFDGYETISGANPAISRAWYGTSEKIEVFLYLQPLHEEIIFFVIDYAVIQNSGINILLTYHHLSA